MRTRANSLSGGTCAPANHPDFTKRELFSENERICKVLNCNHRHAESAPGEVTAFSVRESQMTKQFLAASSAALQKYNDDDLVPIPVACSAIGKGVNSVYRMFSAGSLTKHKIGGSTRVRVAELRKLIGGA